MIFFFFLNNNNQNNNPKGNHPSIKIPPPTRIIPPPLLKVDTFCLGFIFPPAWCVAAILPLPPKPKVAMVEFEGSDASREMAAAIDLSNAVEHVCPG
jgi:hypothetical protein